MFGWHHRLDGHGFGWTPGVGDDQGGLAYCSSWDRKESDMTEWLKWTKLKLFTYFFNRLNQSMFTSGYQRLVSSSVGQWPSVETRLPATPVAIPLCLGSPLFPCCSAHRHLPFLSYSAHQGFLMGMNQNCQSVPSGWCKPCHVFQTGSQPYPLHRLMHQVAWLFPPGPFLSGVTLFPGIRREPVASAASGWNEQLHKPGVTAATLVSLQSCPESLGGDEEAAGLGVVRKVRGTEEVLSLFLSLLLKLCLSTSLSLSLGPQTRQSVSHLRRQENEQV